MQGHHRVPLVETKMYPLTTTQLKSSWSRTRSLKFRRPHACRPRAAAGSRGHCRPPPSTAVPSRHPMIVTGDSPKTRQLVRVDSVSQLSDSINRWVDPVKTDLCSVSITWSVKSNWFLVKGSGNVDCVWHNSSGERSDLGGHLRDRATDNGCFSQSFVTMILEM